MGAEYQNRSAGDKANIRPVDTFAAPNPDF
jgi:hypothetical protein